jgi:Na+-transporting NADH:ubiquinone oxidoreductase subunit C
MNKKLKRSLTTIAFTVGLTFVCTGLIATVNALAKKRIEENKTLFLKRAVRQASGLEPLGRSKLSAWYTDAVSTNSAGHFIVAEHGDDLLVIRQQGAGLWGTIHALIGFSADRVTITGFAVQAHSETPGLGARMEEPWFASQFDGKTGPFTTINPEPKDRINGRSAGDTEMDGITGATVTTKAVRKLMNASLTTAQTIPPTSISHE